MRARLFALAFASATGIAGCFSSAPSSFYALSTADGEAKVATVRSVKLRRPAIAGYLDRPEIVNRIANHRLGVVDTERWGAPLDEMIERILAQDLQQRMPGSSVFTEDGAISGDPESTVEVDVRRFDMDDSGQLMLVAEIAVERSGSHVAASMQPVTVSLVPRAATTGALVAGMSELLGKLADAVATLIRTG